MRRQHGQRVTVYVTQRTRHKNHRQRAPRERLDAHDTFFHSKNRKQERNRLAQRNEYRNQGDTVLAHVLGGSHEKLRKRNSY